MNGALGFHYLIELYQCNKQILTNQAFIKKTMKEAVKIAGANEVGDIFHEFKPMGVSGVILIGESHFSIHT